MALVDHLCAMTLENGLVGLKFTVEDTTGLVVTATLTNNSARQVRFSLDAPDGTRLADGITIGAGASRTAAIPAIRRWLAANGVPSWMNISVG